MPYKIEWIIPMRIMYMYTYGHNTIPEAEQMMRESFELAELNKTKSEYLIHVISDGRHVTQSDAGINDIRRIFGEQKGRATRPGWSLIITPSPIMRFFGSIAMQFIGLRARQVASVEEAIQFLANSEEDLPSYDELMQAYEKVFAQMQLEISEAQ